MKIIEYKTLKDIHIAINRCEVKHSDIWNNQTTNQQSNN